SSALSTSSFKSALGQRGIACPICLVSSVSEKNPSSWLVCKAVRSSGALLIARLLSWLAPGHGASEKKRHGASRQLLRLIMVNPRGPPGTRVFQEEPHCEHRKLLAAAGIVSQRASGDSKHAQFHTRHVATPAFQRPLAALRCCLVKLYLV